MKFDSIALLVGSFICLVDALFLLFFFDSEAGFLLGSFGFVVGLFSSALISKLSTN